MVSILCWCSPASCGGAWGDEGEFETVPWHEQFTRSKSAEASHGNIALQAESATSEVNVGSNNLQHRVLLGRLPIFVDPPKAKEFKHSLKEGEGEHAQQPGFQPNNDGDRAIPSGRHEAAAHGHFAADAITDPAATSAETAAAFSPGGGGAEPGGLPRQELEEEGGQLLPQEQEPVQAEEAAEWSPGEVALAGATSEWRYVEAFRELRALEAAAAATISKRLSGNSMDGTRNGTSSKDTGVSGCGGGYAGLPAASLARVRRIGAHYEANLDMLQWKATDFAVHEVGCNRGPEGGLEEWGARLQDGCLSMVSTTNYPALDIAIVLACRMEKDLEPYIDPEVISKELLEERDVSDSLWHVVKTSKSLGSKLDDVTEDFVVDAIDEATGAIVVFIRTLDPATTAYRGLAIPKPLEGFERTPHYRGLFKFQPLPGGGVRSIYAMQVKLSTSGYRLLSLMPNWVFKRLVRSGAEVAAKNFREVASDPNSVFQERVGTSQRATFYKAMQRRMAAASQ